MRDNWEKREGGACDAAASATPPGFCHALFLSPGYAAGAAPPGATGCHPQARVQNSARGLAAWGGKTHENAPVGACENTNGRLCVKGENTPCGV